MGLVQRLLVIAARERQKHTLQALEDLNVAPSEALMVGDRIEDQEAARAAGVPFRWATAD